MKQWCMCTKLDSVYRDGWSTCSICGGRDAYGSSKERPKDKQKTLEISASTLDDIDVVRKERDALLEMTRQLDEHPEGYDGPCECKLCLSYVDCEGLDFDRN